MRLVLFFMNLNNIFFVIMVWQRDCIRISSDKLIQESINLYRSKSENNLICFDQLMRLLPYLVCVV
jgi:hypothetical protein